MSTETAAALREQVRLRYAEAARAVSEGSGCGCGGGSCCDGESSSADFGEALYSTEQRGELPDAATLASLGCGNPTAVAELREGEVVLDLGSGGGIDVILSAKRVGPAGTAYGLDMTDEMLELARCNAADAGVSNVHFLKGVIEDVPLPASSVDVVISNCVINLAEDKAAVIKEAFRVLRPGGLFAVADMVELEPLEPAVKKSLDAWAGCLSGTIPIEEYRGALIAAGFESPEFQVHATESMPDVDGKIGSAYIRARRP